MPLNDHPQQLSTHELELLLLTSRAALDSASIQRATPLLRRGIRWDLMLRVASAHAVDTLAGARWLELPDARLPASVVASIQARSQQMTMRGMLLSAQLAAVLRALATANIRALTFKGPTLAMQAYRTLTARPFGDVDVLVAPEDTSRAAKVLNGLGYTGWNLDAAHEAHHLRSECEETFQRAAGAGAVMVDLHWALSRPYLPLALNFTDLWRRSITVPVASMPMWTFGCEDLLLYLCFHAGKHAWKRLIWACDIAELLRQERQIDWDALFTRAKQTRSTRALSLGLLLSRELLDAPLPSTVEAQLRQDAALTRRVQQIPQTFAASLTPSRTGLRSYLHVTKFQLWMCDGLRERAHYLRLAALPNMRDRGTLSLPRPLYFLHYLLRPLRLLARHGLSRA